MVGTLWDLVTLLIEGSWNREIDGERWCRERERERQTKRGRDIWRKGDLQIDRQTDKVRVRESKRKTR